MIVWSMPILPVDVSDAYILDHVIGLVNPIIMTEVRLSDLILLNTPHSFLLSSSSFP